MMVDAVPDDGAEKLTATSPVPALPSTHTSPSNTS